MLALDFARLPGADLESLCFRYVLAVDSFGIRHAHHLVRMAQLKRSPAARSRVILVADADNDAARQMARYFSRHGFQASHTPRGEDALRLALSGRLGLVIVDVSLRDMSGHALAFRLKELDPEIPVLMTSGDYRPELEWRARRVGVLYYAHKPADYQVLEAIVAKAVGTSNGRVSRRHSGDG